MADYWKSLPRKFCEFCKCWITDNKPSVEFHERGKKHQENVQKKIAELRKKGQKDYEEQQGLQKMFKKMEDAALKSFKKDIESNPELASQYPTAKAEDVPDVKKPEPNINVKKFGNQGKNKQKHGTKRIGPENPGGSSWERPKEGSRSFPEQSKDTRTKIKAGKNAATASASVSYFGPQPQQTPYGQWTVVSNKIADPVDLELPTPYEPHEFKVAAPVEEQIKFKEKVVTSLKDSTNADVQFKKRKFKSDFKRNIRKKDDD